MRKVILHTIENRLHPGGLVALEPERVLCNDVVLPWENHPHKMRLWVIGMMYGAIAAVWATCEQDALDEMVDKGLGDYFLVSEEDQAKATEAERENWAHLGNAGEAANLDDCWMAEVAFNYVTDCQLIAAFAEARGANADTLEDYASNLTPLNP